MFAGYIFCQLPKIIIIMVLVGYFLTARSGHTLFKNAHHSELRPIGYQDEEVVRRKVYLYAAFICGLVHDAGKVYDLDIVSLNLASPIIWTPSSQSLLDWARENDVVEYEIHWRKRIHNQHNIWSSVFLERI